MRSCKSCDGLAIHWSVGCVLFLEPRKLSGNGIVISKFKMWIPNCTNLQYTNKQSARNWNHNWQIYHCNSILVPSFRSILFKQIVWFAVSSLFKMHNGHTDRQTDSQFKMRRCIYKSGWELWWHNNGIHNWLMNLWFDYAFCTFVWLRRKRTSASFSLPPILSGLCFQPLGLSTCFLIFNSPQTVSGLSESIPLSSSTTNISNTW